MLFWEIFVLKIGLIIYIVKVIDNEIFVFGGLCEILGYLIYI